LLVARRIPAWADALHETLRLPRASWLLPRPAVSRSLCC